VKKVVNMTYWGANFVPTLDELLAERIKLWDHKILYHSIELLTELIKEIYLTNQRIEWILKLMLQSCMNHIQTGLLCLNFTKKKLLRHINNLKQSLVLLEFNRFYLIILIAIFIVSNSLKNFIFKKYLFLGKKFIKG
jgi:hypothetical protein